MEYMLHGVLKRLFQNKPSTYVCVCFRLRTYSYCASSVNWVSDLNDFCTHYSLVSMVVRNKVDNKYITSFNGLGCCSAQTDDDLKLGDVVWI